MRNQSIEQRRIAALPRGVGVGHDFYAVRAENATLWDSEGREFIDFCGGIAVLNTGHRHPKVEAAIAAQLEQFTHTAFQIVPYESYIELAEKVAALTPIDGPRKAAFFTTGAEAVENAVKIARASTGRSGVIAFSGSFHGRTALGMALTGKVVPYKMGFGSMSADIFHIPFPNVTQEISVADSLKALDILFQADIDPARVAAVIVEPVQGEGGFNIAPPELMEALRKICDRHGIVFIADEVQTGFGRTGRFFAMEHYDVRPDLITIAKSLGGGMPISGVVGRADIMDGPAAGGLGGTYAGNPLAVAAALAVIDVIHEEGLCERSQVLGDKLIARLRKLQSIVPALKQVRGLGSMVVAEFFSNAGTPDADAANRVRASALESGLILIGCGVYGNGIRFLYPLTIPDVQFDRALDIIEQSISTLTLENA